MSDSNPNCPIEWPRVSHGTEVGPSQCCGWRCMPKLDCIVGSLDDEAIVGSGDWDWECDNR